MNAINIKDNPVILLTIDVEDWFQVENLRSWFPPESWNHQQLRVEKNTKEILDLLDTLKLNTDSGITPKATFFTLGWIAHRLPNLIREINHRGHEVASHGYNHLMCNHQSERELKEDLIRSKKTIEDILGVEVKGYRAPNFSINDRTLELIRAVGYQYDSSYNNFSKHGRYGIISTHKNVKKGAAILYKGSFAELPISNLNIGKIILPWGGGGYFRLMPFFVFKIGVFKNIINTGSYIFYMHPWEIDPHQPKIMGINKFSRWRHYLNLHKTKERLQQLLKTFYCCKYITCSEYLNNLGLANNNLTTKAINTSKS